MSIRLTRARQPSHCSLALLASCASLVSHSHVTHLLARSRSRILAIAAFVLRIRILTTRNLLILNRSVRPKVLSSWEQLRASFRVRSITDSSSCIGTMTIPQPYFVQTLLITRPFADPNLFAVNALLLFQNFFDNVWK